MYAECNFAYVEKSVISSIPEAPCKICDGAGNFFPEFLDFFANFMSKKIYFFNF